MFKTISLAFSKYPSKERSPEAAALKYRSTNLPQVRGNVFARLNGVLSEEEHDKYITAARNAKELDIYIK